MIRMPVIILTAALGLAWGGNARASDQDASAAVQRALDDDASAATIIKMLVEQGYSQEEATRLAVSETVGDLQLDIAREGICGARDVQEAQSVARAAGEAAAEIPAEIIEGFVQRYMTTGCSEDEMERPSQFLPSGTAPNSVEILGPSSPSS